MQENYPAPNVAYTILLRLKRNKFISSTVCIVYAYLGNSFYNTVAEAIFSGQSEVILAPRLIYQTLGGRGVCDYGKD